MFRINYCRNIVSTRYYDWCLKNLYDERDKLIVKQVKTEVTFVFPKKVDNLGFLVILNKYILFIELVI